MIVLIIIISPVIVGTLTGILLAEAMYGGPSAPARLLTDCADWVARRVMR